MFYVFIDRACVSIKVSCGLGAISEMMARMGFVVEKVVPS
jgi:2-polyprenyl-3-methyl-5-hydroxy-6-metoxy-1,4-benzoquinol methylase